MDRLILSMTLMSALIGAGRTQLKDPPRSFTRLTSYNCLVYRHAFRCLSDGICIPPERVRDGTADCLDGSDEDTPNVNICDYAPYFPDYRCSAYADCVEFPDGYACRCKRGYVGAGELCQPAPLNLPRIMTSPRPLLIQTMKDRNATTTRRIPTLLDLSNAVLKMSPPDSNSADEVAAEENIVITPWVQGSGGKSTNGPTVGTRELHNTSTDTTIDTQGFYISSDFVCPNNTVIINESGQVWCLRLNGGKMRNFSDFNTSLSRVTPSVRPSRLMINLTTDSANGLARKIAEIIAKNLSGDSAGPPSFASTPSRPNGQNETDVVKMMQTPHLDNASDYLMSESVPPGLPNDANMGITGFTPGGAYFGYMPTSATSRKPGDLLPIVTRSSSRTVQGTIITPVKIWNSTGGAITAYRILSNETLPLSCMTGTSSSQIMFLCADRISCVSPNKILDGHEDCSDGSEEVPEFIDECTLGMQWPQYKCGISAKCTDTLKGYTCACSLNFYWNGNTCASKNISVTGDTSATHSGSPIRAVENQSSGNGIRTVLINTSSGILPTSVDIISFPGYATWTSNTGTEGKSEAQVLQNGPSVVFRRPTTLCAECLFPEMVTFRPNGLEGEARQDVADLPTANAAGGDGIRILQTGSSSRVSSVPAKYVNGQPGSGNVNSASTPTPGVTITGTYEPTSPGSIRGVNAVTAIYSTFPRTPSPLIPNFRRPSNYAVPALVNYTTTASTSGNSDWAAVLEALRRMGSTTPGPAFSSQSSVFNPEKTSENFVNFPANGDFFGTLGSRQPSKSTGGATLPPTSGPGPTNGADVRGNGENSPQTSQPFQFGTDLGTHNATAKSPNALPNIFSVGFDPAFGTANSQGLYGQAAGAKVNNTNAIVSSDVSSTTVIRAFGTTVGSQGSVGSAAGKFENVTSVQPDDNSASTVRSSQALGNSVNATRSSEGTSSFVNKVTPASAVQRSSTSFSEYTQYAEYAGTTPTLPPLSFLPFPTARVRSTALPSTTSPSVGGGFALQRANNSRSENLIEQNTGSATATATAASPLADPRPSADPAAFPANANTAATPILSAMTSAPAVAVIIPFGVLPTAATVTVTDGSLTNRTNIPVSHFDETGGPTPSPIDGSPGTNSTLPNSVVSAGTVSPTSHINPNLYPTKILWSVPVGRQDSVPMLSSIAPLSNTTDVVGNDSVPFETEYDCFGDLFRLAYSVLQKNTRTCSMGCSGEKREVCVSADDRCDCVTGTARAGPNGECQPAFQYSLATTMTELCGKPLVFKSFMSDLSNPSTQQLAVVVCYQLEQLIGQSSFVGRYSAGSCRPLGFSAGSVVSNVALSLSSTNATQTSLPFEFVHALDTTLAATAGSLSNDTMGLRVKADQQGTTDANRTQTPASFQVALNDIRECELGIAMCDQNANCRDSFGSYLCSCGSGFVDLNPSFPGRTCALLNLNATLAFQNGTTVGCPKDYYRFLGLCLHPVYFILLIIAFVIAGIIVLLVIGALIACCCRCCNRKRSVLEVPQAALLRAAARSPRVSANEPSGANVDYQILSSSVDKSRLNPNTKSLHPAPSGTSPYSPLSNNNLDLEGEPAAGSGAFQDRESVIEARNMSIDVQTWEEVEVPTHVAKEDDQLSKRALSPSQGSIRSRMEKLGPIANGEIFEERVTTAEVQRTESHQLEIPQMLSDNTSIGSSMDIRRTDYTLPASPSQSVKGLTSAMHIAKKFHLEAQTSIRKASSETREWLAMPRTENLVKEDGLDIDTLPNNDYSKDPVYEVSSPIQGVEGTKLDLLDLQRLEVSGLGNRDSFDDVMDQTTRFYRQSSSDMEYEKEEDLSENILAEDEAKPTGGRKSDEDDRGSGNSKSGAVLQHQPAFALLTSGTDDNPLPQGSLQVDSQDDDDHMSLKSTDEDELRNLRGSLASLKSLKLNGEISHDSVIDQMVDDQAVFYSPTNNSDEEDYFQRKSVLEEQITDAAKDSLAVGGEAERKTSEIQRDIAIHEFAALGERDSIDDFLDDTAPFFSRASTLDSFQLTKRDSGDDLGPRDSRKTSQSMLGVELNGPADPSPRQRRPLLKKRSAFHSRDSMNKIMEKEPGTEEQIASIERDADVILKSDLQEPADQQVAQGVSSASETTVMEAPNRQRFALDDDDIDAFFNQNQVPKIKETRETPTSRRNSGELVGQRDATDGETLEESVVRRQVEDNVRSRRDSQSQANREDAESVEILEEAVTDFDADRKEDSEVLTKIRSREGSDIGQVRNSDGETPVREKTKAEFDAERIEDLERPPSRQDSPNDEVHSILITPPVDDFEEEKDFSGSPRDSEGPQTARQIQSFKRRDANDGAVDTKSVKSVSDHNLQVVDVDSSGQPIVPHDSDSGVYVDTVNADGSRSSAGRQRNAMSSQDDLQVFEGQESRRDGSGSSYQRLSQSDDEEEIMKRYSSAYEKKVRKPKRTRQNYEMGPPESRHVYYSSRPKRMPPNREELDVWKDSTWWRVRK